MRTTHRRSEISARLRSRWSDGPSEKTQSRRACRQKCAAIWELRSAAPVSCIRGGRTCCCTPTFTAPFRWADFRQTTPAVRPKYPFFLPVKVLSRVFRGKFCAGLKRLYRRNQLRCAGSAATLADPKQFRRLHRQDWVQAFGGPPQVLRYLGRYTHRVAISNHRLLAFDGERATFRWKDYAHSGKHRKMTLAGTCLARERFGARTLREHVRVGPAVNGAGGGNRTHNPVRGPVFECESGKYRGGLRRILRDLRVRSRCQMPPGERKMRTECAQAGVGTVANRKRLYSRCASVTI